MFGLNLVSRLLSFTCSRFKGRVPDGGKPGDAEVALAARCRDILSDCTENFEAIRLRKAAADDVLEAHLRWKGRYPSPASVDEVLPQRDDGTIKKVGFDYPKDFIDTFSMYASFEAILAIRAVRPPPTATEGWFSR